MSPGKVLGRGLKDLTSVSLRSLEALESVFERSRPQMEPALKPRGPVKLPRVLVVTSGKGGTGKSFLTVNIASALAALREKVLIIDADFGLANAHLLLGMSPQYDISHLITGKRSAQEVLAAHPDGHLWLLGGCSGIAELSTLTYDQFGIFIREVSSVEEKFDWILVDTSAGISPQVMSFLTAAGEVLLVVNPEATSMLDAYALLKSLFLRNPAVRVGFIANRVKDSIAAKEVFKKLNGAVQHYLKKSLVDLGFVVMDPAVGQSVVQRRPLILEDARSHAAFCLKKIVQKIHEFSPKENSTVPESFFVRLRREVMHWQKKRLWSVN